MFEPPEVRLRVPVTGFAREDVITASSAVNRQALVEKDRRGEDRTGGPRDQAIRHRVSRAIAVKVTSRKAANRPHSIRNARSRPVSEIGRCE